MAEEKDLMDILLDRQNDENITLCDENGDETEFEQIAVIPRKSKAGRDLYAVLRPVTVREGLDNDKVMIFKVGIGSDGEPVLLLEENEKTRISVYLKYLKLLEKKE